MLRRFLLLLLMSGAVTVVKAQATLHRIIVDATLYDDHVTVVEWLDVSSGNADESHVSYDSRYNLRKVLMIVNEQIDKNRYEQIEPWNTSLPSAQKVKQCGFIVNNGRTELHWGLQPHTRKAYLVSYGMKNMMYTTGDADVLDYPFLTLPANQPAEQMELRIHLGDNRKITPELADLKNSTAEGRLTLEDGTVYIRPQAGNTPHTHLDYCLRFQKGLFPNLQAKESTAKSLSIDSLSIDSLFSDIGKFTTAEMNSPMMQEKTPRRELGFYNLWDLIMEYPIITLLLGLVVMFLFYYLYKVIYKALA